MVNTPRESRPKRPLSGERRRFRQPAFEAALYLWEKETHHVSVDLPQSQVSSAGREARTSVHRRLGAAVLRAGSGPQEAAIHEAQPRGLELSVGLPGTALETVTRPCLQLPSKGPVQTHTDVKTNMGLPQSVFFSLIPEKKTKPGITGKRLNYSSLKVRAL